jgi:acetylornithine deacetylase
MTSAAPQARLEDAIDILSHLVSFDTESSKSNLPLVEWVENYLARHGVASLRVPDASGEKAALFVTIGPQTDGGIVLSGHSDVVPVAGQKWTSDPFHLRREGGKLYARGACDMKGFDALVLASILQWQKMPLKAPLHFLLSYDEETTCMGPVDTIARFGIDLPRPRAVIVGEPTMMQVVDAHKAVATYRTLITGREAHSSKPALGASAVQAACEMVSEIYRIGAEVAELGIAAERFDPPVSTVHVGTITGGAARNIMARECSFHWEFRALPGVPMDTVYTRVEAYVQNVLLPKMRATAPEATIVTQVEIEVPGLAPEPGSAAEQLAFRLTKSNRTHAVAFATEAGRFQAAHVPTVVCGPGSIDQAHQPDEFISEEQMSAGLAFMQDLARELC